MRNTMYRTSERNTVLTLAAAVAVALCGAVAGQTTERIEYAVDLTSPHTQIVNISLTVPNVAGESIDIGMPVWRPGRYTILNPAGTVREVLAFDGAGQPLPIEKVRKSIWRVTTGGAKTVRMDYRVYANSLRDRTRHLDDTHAFLSGSAVFMYPLERRDDPIAVRIDAPEDWSIACGLDASPEDDRTLLAPNYDVLVDSPIEVGVHDVLEFDVDGVPHEIVLWGEAEYDADQIVKDIKTLVEEQTKLWGRTPYERYVFLTHVGAGAGGGTEHLNSTIMQTSKSAIEGSTDQNDSYRRFLGLVSHEFFHTWNVKQLRPAGIVPYDYQNENYTKLLWVAEGTTSYYDDLMLARTGLIKPDKYLDVLSKAIDSLRRRPGRKVQSLEESSFDAWIKFARSTPDDVNSTVSFYSKGALVSLLLDMQMRSRTDNSANLDQAMRMLFEQHPLDGGGYTPEDLVNTVQTLTGSDFTTFFDDYVRGTAELDFESALGAVGLEVYFKPAKKVEEDEEDGDDSEGSAEAEEAAVEDDEDTGVTSEDDNIGDDSEAITTQPDELVIQMKADIGLNLSGSSVRSVLSDGIAYDAGFMPGDEFVAIEDERFSGSLNDRLKDFEPGDTITISYFRRDELRKLTIELAGVPDGSWKVRRVEEPTDAQKAAYRSWINQAWPGDEEEEEEEGESTAGEPHEDETQGTG